MPGRRTSPEPDDSSPDGSPGMLGRFLLGLQDYLAARSELLHIESLEAARFAKRQAILAVVLLVAVVFGYALLLLALVPLLGAVLASSLPHNLAPFANQISALLFAGLHLLLALLAASKLRRPPSSPLFEITSSEFEKDRQWINDQQNKNGSNS